MASTMLAQMIQGFYHLGGGSMPDSAPRRIHNALIVAALAGWWIVVLAPRAEAYIDPSAGGMLVQLLLAGTAGVAVLGKLMWSRVKRALGIKNDETPPS